MGFLAGKRLLITGVLSNRSIAYGIARACQREGAELAFSYVGERFKDRVGELAADFGSSLLFDCDVADDAQIERTFEQLGEVLATVRWFRSRDRLRAARSDRRRLSGRPVSRRLPHRPRHFGLQFPCHGQGRRVALRPGAALLTLSYLGALRSVPNYNTMGLAKASLEASVRYLASSLGPRGVRVNGISRRADQDASGVRHQGFRQDPRGRRHHLAAAPQCHDRRRGQRGGLSAFRPGGGGDVRDHLRRCRLQPRDGGVD